MATENIFVNNEWTQLVGADTENFLISWNNTHNLEIASTESTSPPEPGIMGHQLNYTEAITRSTLGSGVVWGKSDSTNAIKIIVTKS